MIFWDILGWLLCIASTTGGSSIHVVLALKFSYCMFAKLDAPPTLFVLQSVIDLGGRFFGGRTVAATFFDEDRFDKQDLAPKEGEFA